MNVTDILQLYTYNRWANAQVLGASAELTREQLHRSLGTSYSSVMGTLTHILWAEWWWLSRWLPSASSGPDPLQVKEFQALRQRWASLEADQTAFLLTLQDPDLVRVVSHEDPYSLSHTLQHVFNHSTYHRGQIATLQRQLGTQPRPTGFLVFLDASSAAGA